jgi:hypothetical protein
MATDAYSSRRVGLDARAAKERRQKQILVGGVVLLGIILAFQVPRVPHRAGGITEPAPVSPAPGTVPAAGGSTVGGGVADFAKRLARLRAFAAKDPFTLHAGSGAAEAPAPLAHGPSVRTSDFVVKDPFVMRTAASAPAPARRHRRRHAVAPVVSRRAYVVVLASIPIRAGHDAAVRTARRARRLGIADASVLASSSYRSLRRGFYVVSGGIYLTRRGARRGLELALARGFAKAYTRPLKH